MNAPKTRGQAIDAHCRACIHDPQAHGTWREQVAACTATDCALWRFRPLQDTRSCPDWIASRNPADLPEGWFRMGQAEAVRTMRLYNADMRCARARQPDNSTNTADAMVGQGLSHVLA